MNRILPRSTFWKPRALGFLRVSHCAKIILIGTLLSFPNLGKAETYLSLTSSPERLGGIGEVLAGSSELILSPKIKKIYLNLPNLYRNTIPYDENTIRQLPRDIVIRIVDKLKADKTAILAGTKPISPLLPAEMQALLLAGADRSALERLSQLVHEQITEKLFVYRFEGGDLGPLSKFLPAIKHLCEQGHCNSLATKADETFVISIDDDHKYPSEYLDHLITHMQASPNKNTTAIAYKTGEIQDWGIPTSAEGFYFPKTPSSQDMIEGWGAIIYRARLVNSALMEVLSKRSLECRLSDDLVISFALGIQNLESSPAGRKVKVKHSSKPIETTDIGALSKGSGLETWHNKISWNQLKTFISIPRIIHSDYPRIGLPDHLLPHSEMNTKPFHPESTTPSDVSEATSGKKMVTVLGHPKVGYVGKNYLHQLFNRLDSEGKSEKLRFEEFMTLTSMKVDGFKYMKCLYQINLCARNSDPEATTRWKKSADIITSCSPLTPDFVSNESQIVTTLQPLSSFPSSPLTQTSAPIPVADPETPKPSHFPLKTIGIGLLILGSAALIYFKFKPTTSGAKL